jgi:DegV family protein with EDD domain
MIISIVTDSTCDIPDELAQANRIHIVPNLLIIDGKEYQDGRGFSRREYYERLPGMKRSPTTATASPGAYQQLYEHLFMQGATRILSIHASSLLSGIYNAACSAAQAFNERVQVIDSGQVSLGLGFQVLAAAEAIARGASLEAVMHLLGEIRKRIRVYAMLDTLEYIRRSGRVSWARAQLGNFLQIKLFVEVRAGEVLRSGEARTRKKGIERLIGFLLQLGSLERLAILHTNAEEDARNFLRDLDLTFPYPPLVVNITTVIGTHVGPNALGFATVLAG